MNPEHVREREIELRGRRRLVHEKETAEDNSVCQQQAAQEHL